MRENLEALIRALREELQQYGEMLALLDQQQECVTARAADDVLGSISAIQTQSAAVRQARAHREECRRVLALALEQSADAPFARIIPLLPVDYRPLVGALVQENNELLVRIQQRARQNHLLLHRSVEMLQRFLSRLMPAFSPAVYNDSGNMMGGSTAAHPLYEAVG